MGNSDIVVVLLQHGAVVNLPNDVRHSNTMHTVDIGACTYYYSSHC